MSEPAPELVETLARGRAEADIAAALIEACAVTSVGEDSAQTPLVSVTVEILGAGPAAYVDARIERRTKTLVFMSAEAFAEGGARIATATSVHKILSR